MLSASALLRTDVVVVMGSSVIGVAACPSDLLMRSAEPRRVPWTGRMSVARLAVCGLRVKGMAGRTISAHD